MDELIQTISLRDPAIRDHAARGARLRGAPLRRHDRVSGAHQPEPARHIDPIGTLLVPLLTLLLGGILFGWAKPVPVNFAALRRPKQDMLWVALAGPASNLVMALGWALVYKFAWSFPDNYFAEPMLGMAEWGIKINAVLMVLNLLPLPPLDGGRVAVSLLPHRQAFQLAKIEPYGMFILIFLAITPVLSLILSPLVNLMYKLITFLFGL
jgi:Zn-dependent protease